MPAFRPSQPTGPYIVNGIPLDHGESPGIRQELRKFKENKDLWNLYLIGLWQFQLVPMDDQLSYFQVAGIHGLPYQSWPLEDSKLKGLKKQNSGFCTHTSILFLTWHRPYLALFEHILKEAIVFVANQFTNEEGKQRYLTTAKSFRIPYWDWADPTLPVFPVEATDSNVVQVTMPEALRKVYSNLDRHTDGSVTIPNPLFAYRFQKGVGKQFKVEDLSVTTRYQSSGDKKEPLPEAQKEAIESKLTPYSRQVNQQLPVEGNLMERVTYLVRSYEVFDQVSHNQWDPTRVPAPVNGRLRGLGFGSFEDIHNTVHVLVGGTGQDKQGRSRSGHMGSVPISAFDPIFWLHHTNIDRLVSIWEALHANPKEAEAWVTTKTSESGSWVTKAGDDEDLKTPLAPFYKDKDNFWTSDEVRDTTTFGYAYPETKSWQFSNINDFRGHVEQALRDLYPSGSLATMIAAGKAGDESPETILRSRAEKLAQVDATSEPSTAITALSLVQSTLTGESKDSAPALSLPPINVPNIQVPDGRSLITLAKHDKYLEWLVNIKALKHALGGEYAVHVFLGPVPAEESTVLYAVSPYHVGTFTPLGQSEDTACEKCQLDQRARVEVSGQIPLTIALAERYFAGQLNSLEEADVIAYLQTNLHWEVVNKEGQRLQNQRDAVDGLLVGVASNEVTLPQNVLEGPRYSADITIYPQITTKQDGTSGRAEGTGVTEDNTYLH